jgi:hypothetical protein
VLRGAESDIGPGQMGVNLVQHMAENLAENLVQHMAENLAEQLAEKDEMMFQRLIPQLAEIYILQFDEMKVVKLFQKMDEHWAEHLDAHLAQQSNQQLIALLSENLAEKWMQQLAVPIVQTWAEMLAELMARHSAAMSVQSTACWTERVCGVGHVYWVERGCWEAVASEPTEV